MPTDKEFIRFNLPQRVEHWLMVISFTVLAVTGLPQKFAGDGWAETMIAVMGGIEFVRWVHHASAIILVLVSVYHLISLFYKVIVQRIRWTIFPQLQDVQDAIQTVLYNAGIRKEAPVLDRFSFGEKFEYWALVWGTIIMALTGFMLWNPIIASRFVSGEMIPAAKAAHGAEAILAILAVLVWHVYNVHLKEFNRSMFTGKISEHQMQEEHAAELALIEQGKAGYITDPIKIKRRQRLFVPVAAVLGLGLLFLVFLFTTAETTAVTTIRRTSGQQVQIYAPQTKTPTPPRAATAIAGQATPAGNTAVPAGAKALPGDHAGRTTCQACHATGVGGAPQNPPDHAGRLDTQCRDCHKEAGAAPLATAQPATPAASSTGAPQPTTATGGATTAKPLPADHAGRTTCQACHASGVGGAPTSPADHAGRLDAQCQDCHKSAGASSGASANATPTASSGGAAPGGIAAALPADHAGRTTCLACHQTGVGGAKAIPASHTGRTDETCVACHKPQ